MSSRKGFIKETNEKRGRSKHKGQATTQDCTGKETEAHGTGQGWSLDNVQKYRRGASWESSLYSLVDDLQCCQEVRNEM